MGTQWCQHHPRYKLQYVHAMYVLVVLGKVHKCKVQKVATTCTGTSRMIALVNGMKDMQVTLKVRGTERQHQSVQVDVECRNSMQLARGYVDCAPVQGVLL